jgi:hypothetical protein
LVSVLEKNFNIKSTVQSAGSRDSYIIYIWKDSINKVRNIVLPYMVPAMKYKIY